MAKAKKKRRKQAPKKRKPAPKKRREARRPNPVPAPLSAPPVTEPTREEALPDDFDERVGVEAD